jgi:hypothetical protein
MGLRNRPALVAGAVVLAVCLAGCNGQGVSDTTQAGADGIAGGAGGAIGADGAVDAGGAGGVMGADGAVDAGRAADDVAGGGAEAAGTGAATRASACRNAPLTNTVRETGSALRATVTAWNADSGALNFVVPTRIRDRFPEFSPGEVTNEKAFDFTDGYDRVMTQGGFVYGHPHISVLLENPSGRQVTIYGLRAVNTRTVCMPGGLLVVAGSEGGGPPEIAMNLDADRPTGRPPW